MLAKAGFRAIGVDMFLHGDRPEAGSRQMLLDLDFVSAVRDIIYETAGDMPDICRELGVDMECSGLLGISAGGFAAHVLATRKPQFRALAFAITSPDWLAIDPTRTPDPASPEGMLIGAMSPVNDPDAYLPSAVFMINVEDDDTVRTKGAKTLYQRLHPRYAAAGLADKLEFYLYPGTSHFYNDEMVDKTVEFFERHLAAPPAG
jgi:pimeloyl-ACP methyl ester carboxylesterase